MVQGYKSYENDGELPLLEYWHKYKHKIAELRGWGKKARNSASKEANRMKTLETYDRYMTVLGAFIPKKPMAELTVFELLGAVSASRVFKNKVYSDSTLKTRFAVLNDVYKFAQDRGDACNDLQGIDGKEVTYFLSELSLPPEERKKALKKRMEENRGKLGSLTKSQENKLGELIIENIETDGRYLALAVMLYCGLRPSECRGLLWADLIPFLDYPERHMLSIVRQGGNHGELIDRLKRPASYRKIGVHFELEEIIHRRWECVRAHCPAGVRLEDCPMCCFKDDIGRMCTPQQLAAFAIEILRESIRVSDEVFAQCVLEMYIQGEEQMVNNAEDLKVCTYLLRHNFWTWIQATTELTADEKRYYMGHAIFDGRINKRLYYNLEDRLWDMLVKLDHEIKCLALHEPLFHTTIMAGGGISIENIGRQRLLIPPELLRSGGTLTIIVRANEATDPVEVTFLSPSRNFSVGEQKLKVQVQMLPYTPEATYRSGLNCDYDTWMGAKRLRGKRPGPKEDE